MLVPIMTLPAIAATRAATTNTPSQGFSQRLSVVMISSLAAALASATTASLGACSAWQDTAPTRCAPATVFIAHPLGGPTTPLNRSPFPGTPYEHRVGQVGYS